MADARISGRMLAVVVVGGSVGVAGRAALTVPLLAVPDALVVPLVTLVINVVGSFLLGVLVGRLGESRPLLRGFVGTGILGGFTTYSAFAVHTVALGGAAPVIGMLLALAAIALGVLAAALGLRLGGSAPSSALAPEDAE